MKATHWAILQWRIWRTKAHAPKRLETHPGNRMVRRCRERFRDHENRCPPTPSCPASGASRTLGVTVKEPVWDPKTASGFGRQRTRRTSTHQSSQWQTAWRTRRVVVDLQSRLLWQDCLCGCLTVFDRFGLCLFISEFLRGSLFEWSCFTTKRNFGHL